LRLMAVAWAGDRIGAAAKPLTVRDPVVAEALLPRFLAPGDEARLPVLLHNLDLPAGEVTATLSAEGAIALAGPARLAASLAPGARALPASAIRATAAGQGVLRLAIAGPDGFSATREARITVRSSRPVTTEVAASEPRYWKIAPGKNAVAWPDFTLPQPPEDSRTDPPSRARSAPRRRPSPAGSPPGLRGRA